MAQTVAVYEAPVIDASGARYAAKACGREREDGLWEGWLEFEDTATGAVLRTGRETTQPNLADLTYWATGLSAVYLEGALSRTLRRTPAPDVAPVPRPHYQRPASTLPRPAGAGDAILNPFSVYEKSPDLLAKELTALRGWHLRQIIRDYDLAPAGEGLDIMSEPELGALILRRVRELHP